MILYKNIFIFLFFFISVIISPANAYIDPGTGSFILQAIIAVGASIIVFFKNPITMIKLYFKSKKEKKKIKKDNQ